MGWCFIIIFSFKSGVPSNSIHIGSNWCNWVIITQTPYRISLFGGGTDYPQWFKEYGGAVIGTTINKYCYISVKDLPPFFDYKYRIVWSKIEHCKTIEEIQHPSVRACLQYMKVDKGLEIHHMGDLPARTGIGSSSAFTVGLLKALGCKTPVDTAIHIEQDILKENVGCQDQIFAGYGGFLRILFSSENSYIVERLEAGDLEDYLMLFFTGFQRTASEIVRAQLDTMPHHMPEMKQIQALTRRALLALDNQHYRRIGDFLHESWMVKKTLSPLISNPQIDDIYQRARDAGARGGKLCGAGGGGMMLLFVEPEFQDEVREALSDCIEIPFLFEKNGCRFSQSTE